MGFHISINVNKKNLLHVQVCLKDYYYEAIGLTLSLRILKRNVLKNDIGVIAYCIIRVFIFFLILNEVL